VLSHTPLSARRNPVQFDHEEISLCLPCHPAAHRRHRPRRPRPPQHSLDHRRGHERDPGLLWRRLRHHAEHRRVREGKRALHACLRLCAGLLAVAILPDHRLLRAVAGNAADALGLPDSTIHAGLSGLAAQGGLLRVEQRQNGLQQRELEGDHRGLLGREQPDRALAGTGRKGQALFQHLQSHDLAPEPFDGMAL